MTEEYVIDEISYKRRWLILATLCVALIGVMLANSSLNMAVPSISVDLGLTQLELTWIVNIYSLLFASLLFLAGTLGDRYGRKRALQIGSLIFAASALYAGLFAQSGMELIIARGLMGIGGALVMPTTLSIINTIFPKEEKIRAIAIWSAVCGVGMLLGNVVSGLILELSTWNSIFYLSFALAAAGLIINQIVVRESRDTENFAVDWLGGIFAALGIFGIIYAITEGPSNGIFDVQVFFCICLGIISLVAFVLWEKKFKSPLLDMKLFGNKKFSLSTLTLILTFLAMSGVFFTLSQLQQLILGMSPLIAALSMIPAMLPMLFMAPVIPNIINKIGERMTIVLGLLLASFAFLIMSAWTADITYWNLLFVQIMLMIGVSCAMMPSTNILMASVPINRSGMGSAMNDTTRELGSAIGVAMFGAILSSLYLTNISKTTASLAEPLKSSLETSLATALDTAQSLGAEAVIYADAAKEAWMGALTTAAMFSTCITFITAILVLIVLKKDQNEDDVSEKIGK